ncbi:MAG: uroporphyrinogen-III C-methyltransferase [Pseudomonadota bacterium]
MNDDLNPPAAGASPGAALPVVVATAPMPASPARWLWLALAVLGALCVASLVLAWKADQRGASLEQELVRRQQESAGKATEARAFAKQAQESAGATAAKTALLEARVAEVAVQRSQLEDLIQSLSRSRDENVLVDIEAAIRVALQQNAITGSAEPLVATLRQSDERLARYNQPRLEGVRRAIARDLARVKATSVADIASLGIKLDEAIRIVDDLPLLAVADSRSARDSVKQPARAGKGTGAASAATPASAASASASWSGQLIDTWNAFGETVWSEAKSLVRVTRINHPEAMLLAPEQSFFVRENLKLRLLNARLALLSRQFDTAQSDLQATLTTLDRYFDRSSKRTVLVTELIRQVAGQARQVVVPRPDDTLAALTAASAGR